VNERQRYDGSTPRSTTRSRSSRRTLKKAFSGQITCRVTPATSWTCGRRDWKSKCSSGSIVATRFDVASFCMSQVAAVDEASAASFHPSNPATSTGRRKGSGASTQRRPFVMPTG